MEIKDKTTFAPAVALYISRKQEILLKISA